MDPATENRATPSPPASALDGGDDRPPPMCRLPTLQRNALRKIFERASFTPEDVANLGHKRLHQAEGIGQKGLEIIVAWLAGYGYQLKTPESVSRDKSQEIPKRMKRNLESALRMLRTNGYVVYRRRNSETDDREASA